MLLSDIYPGARVLAPVPKFARDGTRRHSWRAIDGEMSYRMVERLVKIGETLTPGRVVQRSDGSLFTQDGRVFVEFVLPDGWGGLPQRVLAGPDELIPVERSKR